MFFKAQLNVIFTICSLNIWEIYLVIIICACYLHFPVMMLLTLMFKIMFLFVASERTVQFSE